MVRPNPPTAPRANRGRLVARLATLIVAGVVALILLGVVMSSWRNIRPGYVGIVFDKASHEVKTEALEPGWTFINPLTQAIQEYPVTIRTYAMVQTGDEGEVGDQSVKVQSSEGQQLNLDVVIQYQVIRTEADELYEDWGGAEINVIETSVVRQYTRSVVPVFAARYGWEEITASRRGQLAEEISAQLATEFKARHLELVSFGIREVHLPASLQTALDNKITAQQAAEQQEYQLQQAEVRAEQARVEAQGEADARRIRAEGEAAANVELAQSLTPELIRYQMLLRWDGKLPVVQGSGTNMLIDASSLVGEGSSSTPALPAPEPPAP